MPRPWRIRYAGAKYHVTSRGNGRESVFLEPADYERFLAQLSEAKAEDGVILYAYVLMLNHYHLLVETPRGNIQKFMQRLNTAYSMYFRYKKARPGHCFQGRYGAKLVAGDDYIVRLTRYMHLNPVKVRRLKDGSVVEKRSTLRGYAWSSYGGYAGLRAREEAVDYRWLALMGRRGTKANQEAYRAYVEGFLSEDDDVLREAFGASRYAIGDEDFRRESEGDLKEARLQKGIQGDIAWPLPRVVGVDEIQKSVMEAFGIARKDLMSRGRRTRQARLMALELSCQLTGKTQRELSQHFGYRSESSIGKQRKSLAALCGQAPQMERLLLRLKRQLRP